MAFISDGVWIYRVEMHSFDHLWSNELTIAKFIFICFDTNEAAT